MSNTDVVILGYARTPFGAFQGALAALSAPKLGAHAIRAALARAGVKPTDVSEVFMGNVLSAGVGQAPARQAALGAGLPESVPCTTVNKVCGSGMKALMLGAQAIRLGEADVVVAGGMESMTQTPYLLPNARAGLRMGNAPFLDAMIHDGLWDPYKNQHMGNCGELCAREKQFTREDQDTFAIGSFKRANENAAKLEQEIAPIDIPAGKGETVAMKLDEGPAKAKYDKIPTLKPVFDKAGTITAANASTINDGAAALVLASRKWAESHGLNILGRLVATGQNAQAPEWFTTAPAEAMRRAMSKAGWEVGSVDLWEVNEAFAVVALAAERELKIPRDRLNIWGGAISIGHPIGASGARIVGTLIQQLRDTGKKRGVAGICIGGGEATAVCVEV